MSEIIEITKALVDFRDERDWKQFHDTAVYLKKKYTIKHKIKGLKEKINSSQYPSGFPISEGSTMQNYSV